MESQLDHTTSFHVVMFPFFAFGHINPFVNLSNKLASHGFQISFLSAPGNIQRISSSLISSPLVKIIPLEIPAVDGLPPGLHSTSDTSPAVAELLKKAIDQMQPQIKSILINLKPHFVFFDFAQQWIPSIASPLGIKTLFFPAFNAASLALLKDPPKLETSSNVDKLPTVEYLKKPPPGFPSTSIASMKTYIVRDLLYIYMSFHGGPCVYDRVTSCLKSCDAIVIRSYAEMEGPYIDFIKTKYGNPVLLAGHVVPEPPKDQLEEKWAKWLGSFPSKSVVYCSFGSEMVPRDEEIKELVLGLESTGLPFLVVFNSQHGGISTVERLKKILPEGFEERVKDKGVIHCGWVQQQLILAHDSVGCFVTHSGLSGIAEALMNDCQLVLLPQMSDQFVNAMLVSGDLKAGVEVIREDETGYFVKEDLCKAVKTLMVDVNEEPGKSIRENHGKWREFLLDKEVHERCIGDLVMELKKMLI